MLFPLAVAALMATGALATLPIELPLTFYNGMAGQGQMWLVNISIGSPPQDVTVQIDTGSSDLWVFAKDVDCGNTLGCLGGSYDPSASSTYATDLPGEFVWSYGSGSNGTGDYIREDVHIGEATVKNFRVGLTNASSGHSALWGIMGLGFPGGEFLVNRPTVPGASSRVKTRAVEDEYPVLVQELASQGQISAAAFSIYLNTASNPGSILFGGIDQAKYSGEITEVDVLPQGAPDNFGQWYVNLTGLGLTDGEGETSWFANASVAGRAFIDSGAPKAFLPGSGSVPAIYSAGGAWRSDLSQSVIACSAANDTSGATIDFALGPNDAFVVHVPISHLVDPFPDTVIPVINGEPACSFGLGPGPDGFQVLGDGFLKGVYAVFNMDTKKVGLAQVKYDVTEKMISPISSS